MSGAPARLQPGRPLVAICAELTFEPWNGDTPDTRGIGGSQTGAVRLSEELVRLGHRVLVFCPCAGMEGTFRGVEYLDIGRFPGFAATHFLDVFIALRHATLLELPVRAARRYLWVKDIRALRASTQDDDLVRRHYDRLDAILCVSPWQRETFAAIHGVPMDKIVVTRNGIDPERFGARVRRRRHRFIYSSSPERGLGTLLELFPRIRARLPGAELHVFYGFDNWNRSRLASSDRQAWRSSNRAGLTQEGVFNHGRIGQKQLALEMLRSDIWFYPTHFSETYCITALEAQMAGAVCVTSDLAALRTTVGDRGILIPGDPSGEEYRERALAEVFSVLEDRERRRRFTDRARRWARQQTWSRLAEEWVALFRGGN